ncbi:MAG: hypothetical protein HOP32_14455 [Nitrospira sp.]|nr:hypothetical protein [Nitrospira sp.]
MSIQRNAQDLFEYIAEVYSIDLPVIRDVLGYGDGRWWQAELMPSRFCKTKCFDDESDTPVGSEDTGGAWLSVLKSACDPPPPLPESLVDWVQLSPNPSKRPSPRPKISKRHRFDDDPARLSLYDDYRKAWINWEKQREEQRPGIPDLLKDWLDLSLGEPNLPTPIQEQEREERFEDDQNRQVLFDAYLTTQWPLWADRTLPAYRANELYDQLFSLHQRLSVEGDRWEILWGHLFLNWQHSPGQAIYHPLLLTPIFLEFNPEKRNITLTPSQLTKFDLECLRDLEYNYKDTLLSLARRINDSEEPSNPWSHNTVRGLSATVSGYLSSTAESETNLYSDKPVSKPLPSPKPTISNAPIIFVRERVRHFWIEDARKVAAAIAGGAQIPPFIHAAVSDPGKDNALSLALGPPLDGKSDVEEEDSELYFPLLHNDQQKEIWERLRHQFGVLVQGPPGTGKSHTIANIICDQLARGKKILVTSQTENALRVLRGHIPTAIRSLCVSQLGNDTESKKQLHEAVMEIGQHLAEKGSQARQLRIQNLKKGLRVIREEQACLQNQIRDWAKLDSEVIQLGEEKLTAHQAAKACSLGQERHGWLPDKLSPETLPPLNDHELRELCQTLRELNPEDRKSCQSPLPALESLPPPQKIREILSELRTSKALVDETEPLRRDWSEKLASASHSELSEAVAVVETALTSLQQISEDWQSRILDLMVSEDSQQSFWSNFISACSELREKAFRCFERIQGYQIEGLSLLDAETDWADALEELARVVGRGGNPGKLFAQLSLSKQAKTLFQTVVVDAKPLSTKERIDVVAFRLEYVSHIRKLETRWLQTTRIVEGPRRDQQAPMALADIDARLRKVRDAVEWARSQMGTLKERLTALGCPKIRQVFHREAILLEHLKCLQGQIAAKRVHDLFLELNHFSTCADELSRDASCGSTLLRLAEAVRHQSSEEYESHYAELLRLYDVRVKVQRLEELLKRLQSKAPKWASEIERKAQLAGPDAISPDWQEAWKWQRLTQWLSHLHSRESVEDLQAKAEKLRNKEHEHITELVIERTWHRQLENVSDQHYMALAAWAAAMKNYGKGTGKFAGRFLAAAARAMIDAVKAVPVWIMPLYRVVQSFHAEPELFDLVIIDEASQCDIRALPVLFRARQVLIVGDPEQISPTNVGVEREKVFELIRIRLAQLPHPERFIIDNSLFEITQTIPGMTRTMLTEHFRCVPEIIEFNNSLCPTYAGRLEPLRQTNPHERLEPPIITSFVPSGFKNDSDVNQPEAEALVEALVLSCQCEKYTGKTMGVISLLGENQAKYISDLIARKLDERECSQRRIICGDAYAFQGDERDVMFLSLVVAPNASFASLVRNDARQRFNVATSRAKDQVFLFHSIRIEDVKNEDCVRYKLLKWYQNPPLAEMEAGIEILRQKADSPFEIEVGTAIIKRGFKVIPQFRPFPRDLRYRIDLLVQGTRGRLAVECDGDQWHGPERWEYDQRRETQLRRAGLNFWRINGSTFYRDKNKALDSLWPAIERHCTGQ